MSTASALTVASSFSFISTAFLFISSMVSASLFVTSAVETGLDSAVVPADTAVEAGSLMAPAGCLTSSVSAKSKVPFSPSALSKAPSARGLYV